MSPGYPKMSRMSVLPMRSRQKPSSIFHHNDSLSVLTTLGHPCGVMTVRWSITTFPWPHARPVYTWRTSKVKRWCDIPALSSMYLAVSKWLDNVDASHDPQCSVSVTVAVWPVQMETYFTSGDPHQQTYIPQFYLVYTYFFYCLSDTIWHYALNVFRHFIWQLQHVPEIPSRPTCYQAFYVAFCLPIYTASLWLWNFHWHPIDYLTLFLTFYFARL